MLVKPHVQRIKMKNEERSISMEFEREQEQLHLHQGNTLLKNCERTQGRSLYNDKEIEICMVTIFQQLDSKSSH